MLRRDMVGLRPTYQRVEGYPYGECVRAAYATLLGLPIEKVPRFDPAALRPGESQSAKERRWLWSRGFELAEIATTPDQELPQELLDSIPPVYHFISGLSPRGLGHRCVGCGGRVLFDPHPSNAGLVTVYSVGFVVPRGLFDSLGFVVPRC